jgi:hypothetical protein
MPLWSLANAIFPGVGEGPGTVDVGGAGVTDGGTGVAIGTTGVTDGIPGTFVVNGAAKTDGTGEAVGGAAGAERGPLVGVGTLTTDPAAGGVAVTRDCAVARGIVVGGAGVSNAGLVVPGIPAGGSPVGVLARAPASARRRFSPPVKASLVAV